MTAPADRAAMPRDYDPGLLGHGGDPYLRRAGRALVQALYSALRAIRLYPLENEAVRKTIDEVNALASEILEKEGELELRVTTEFIFVNSTRLRLDLDNYASFTQILSLCRANGIGAIRVREGAAARDWQVLLGAIYGATGGEPPERLLEVSERLHQREVTVFELGPPVGLEDESDFHDKAKQAAKRTYSRSVAVAKEVMNSSRMGQPINIKRIKRVVQSIVDQILNEETSLLGLTTIRDYDEYTFTHSVNVCIFSVALGRRMGLGKRQLYDLGLAALFHDIGKSRVPIDILNKPSGLSDEDWRVIAAHPWQGVLQLFQMKGQADLPYRAMTVAFEHHMKTDLTGYPRPLRPRTQSIYSKIVAVADGFDAATSRRAYQSDPLSPAAVLAGMRDNPKRGMDPVVVKAFINLLGIYPVGTVVVLDTFELAIVHAVNPNPDAISRPLVRIISDDRGNVVYPGQIVDLTEHDPARGFLRTIIKTENPDRYGINVGDYFV